MTIKSMFLITCVVLPLTMLAQAQPGQVLGSVIAADTSAPLIHAAIILRPLLVSGRAGRIVRGNTDQKGEFILAGLTPGPYMLTAEREGYQQVTYAAGAPTLKGTRFTLKPGEAKSIQLRLTPLGSVAGTVFGPDGSPLVHAKVMLSHYRAMDGMRVLLPEREVWTDPNGNFRATGVPSGQYLLSAFSRNEGRLDNVAKVYPASYLPGVPAPTGAQPINVEAGRTTGDLKLHLGAAQGFAISGQVSDSTSAPLPGATVLARRQSEDGVMSLLSSDSLTVKTGSMGEFLLTRLLRGRYRIIVTGGPNTQRLTGTSVVDLGNADLKNVLVAMAAGSTITGKIVFEGNFPGGKGPVNPRVTRLALRSQIDAGRTGLIGGVIAQDGTFRIENAPEGPARLGVSLVTDVYYVKSISLHGQDLTNQPLNVGKNERIDDVEIVISLAAGQVAGQVAPDTGSHTGEITPVVLLFPEDNQSRLTKLAHVNAAGQFVIRGIAPGNYRIVAVRGPSERATDPAFLASVYGQARQVAVIGVKATVGIMQAIDAPR